jgi:ABC-type phosphate transport system substrate-binding protein
MKKMLASSLFTLCLFNATIAWCDDVYVIANQVSLISASDIRDIFTGEKQVDHDVKVTPIDNLAVKGEFLEKALNVTQEKYLSIWVKKGFRDGLNPPVAKSSDLEVISAVKSSPGAVGYVSKPTSDVKVIKKF